MEKKQKERERRWTIVQRICRVGRWQLIEGARDRSDVSRREKKKKKNG